MSRTDPVRSLDATNKLGFVIGFAPWIVILLIGLAGVVVAALDAHAVDASEHNIVELVLNWVVPIAVIWGAIWFTGTYPDRVNRTEDAAESAGPR